MWSVDVIPWVALITLALQIGLVLGGRTFYSFSLLGRDITHCILIVELDTALGNSLQLNGCDLADIVVARPDAMIICVADVHFHVLMLLTEQWRDSLRFVEGWLAGGSILQTHGSGVSASEPRESFVSKGI